MNKFAKPLALLALALTIVPPGMILLQGLSSKPTVAAEADTDSVSDTPGPMSDGLMKNLMFAGTLLWFAAAPYWLKEDD